MTLVYTRQADNFLQVQKYVFIDGLLETVRLTIEPNDEVAIGDTDAAITEFE